MFARGLIIGLFLGALIAFTLVCVLVAVHEDDSRRNDKK